MENKTYPEVKRMANGHKGQQRPDDKTDRALAYKESIWDSEGYCHDADYFRYFFDENGRKRNYAWLEITKRDVEGRSIIPPSSYFDVVLERYRRDEWLIQTSEELKCPVYIVVYQDDCEYRWVYNFTEDKKKWLFHKSIKEHNAYLTYLYYKAMATHYGTPIPEPPIDEDDEW